MSDIQKEIKETLNLASQDFDKGAYVHAYEKIEEHAYTWLLYQQELIEQKDQAYSRLHSDWQTAGRGLNVRLEEINRLRAENDKLREALIRERDDAKIWDGIGVVNRINKVLKGADTCAP